jgi:hypothetical protein
MARWEYCVLVGITLHYGTYNTNYPRLIRFTKNGVEYVNEFKNLQKGEFESVAVAKVICQLGEDGWELIGDAIGEQSRLWFKRPLSE